MTRFWVHLISTIVRHCLTQVVTWCIYYYLYTGGEQSWSPSSSLTNMWEGRTLLRSQPELSQQMAQLCAKFPIYHIAKANPASKYGPTRSEFAQLSCIILLQPSLLRLVIRVLGLSLLGKLSFRRFSLIIIAENIPCNFLSSKRVQCQLRQIPAPYRHHNYLASFLFLFIYLS